MWSRRLSTSMGIDANDFARAFIIALGNDDVINKLDSTICQHLNMNLQTLTTATQDLKKELDTFRTSNQQLRTEVSELRELVKKKDDRIKNLEGKAIAVELTLDEHEQYSRRNSLRISGVNETGNEDIGERVLGLFNKRMKLQPPITADEIDRVHRTGPMKEGATRPVLVKFATYRTRHRVFSNKKTLKSKDNNAAKTPVYINEDLTRRRANLLWKARSHVKNNHLRGCWSSDGTVLVLNNYGKVIVIKTEQDLEIQAALKQNGPP